MRISESDRQDRHARWQERHISPVGVTRARIRRGTRSGVDRVIRVRSGASRRNDRSPKRARNRLTRCASASISAVSTRPIGRCSTTTVERLRRLVVLRVPDGRALRRPPGRRPCTDRRHVRRGASSSDANRDRSACDSSALSYSGKNRTGAITSASGRGASGRSYSSRPRSSRNSSQLRSQTIDHLAQAGQPGPRGHVGHAGRTERSEVPQHDGVDRRLVARASSGRRRG